MLFADLPLEILPEILAHIVKPHHLASACLVNTTFKTFATPYLYERISIYSWHRDGKTKVIKLFGTLSRYPHLARFLQKLDIRDFPKFPTMGVNSYDLEDMVLTALSNCTNLKSCIWTRDGSLDSDILRTLRQSKTLSDFEFNGHSDGQYDPRLLPGFTDLRRISIIMPSASVVAQLGPWLSHTGSTLRNFTLICKSSLIITDRLLESIAPSLVNLEHLHLTGCPKITEQGAWSLVSSNANGLLGLGLEGVSPKFNMSVFANKCIAYGTLKRLNSLTLTVHQQLPMKEWIASAIHLISASPVELFQIYSSGAFFESTMTDDLWNQLIVAHGKRLIRFSIHRMLISIDAIRDICLQCTNLEQLFVVVEPSSLGTLAECLSHAEKLQTIHINYPAEANADTRPIMEPDQALTIINRCSPTITQFGCNTKVWQIERRIVRQEDGSLQVLRVLAPYGHPEIPEQFQVVRT